MKHTIPVIVTYLEQTFRPSLPTPPRPPGKIALLRAEHPPVHFYRYLYRIVGEPYNWVSRLELDDSALQQIITHPKVLIYVLYCNGVPAGFTEIDARNTRVPEIKFFGLTPDFTGKQYGRYFLTQVIDLAWNSHMVSSPEVANGPERIRLETCTLDHPAALPLYQKFGFTVFAQRQGEVTKLDDLEIGIS